MRDGLLGRLPERPDLDLVVPAGAISLCNTLARQLRGSAVVLDSERDIARLVLHGWSFDLAACEGSGLEADLGRRDYSINAIALPLQQERGLLDPTGGLADLERRELRAISEANLLSDPLRLLRGLRLSCELDFRLAPQTQAWIEQHCAQLGHVASERVLAELEKLACAPAGETGLLQAVRSGLLQPWLASSPTLDPPLSALGMARAEVLGLHPQEQAWALPLARLSCLADARSLDLLRSSRALQKRVKRLRQVWQQLSGRQPSALTEPERFDLHRSLEADLPALLLLLPMDQEPKSLLLRWRDATDPLCHPHPPCDGAQLQALLGIQPGPQLGALLTHLSQERAFGRLAADADADAVLHSARRWLGGH